MNVAAKSFLSSASPDSFVRASREELRQETGNRDRKRNKLHRLCAWSLGIASFFFFFSLLFYLNAARSPKMEQEYRDIRFFSHFYPAFKTIPSSDPVCRVPRGDAHVFHFSKGTSECLRIPAAHKNSPEDPFQP